MVKSRKQAHKKSSLSESLRGNERDWKPSTSGCTQPSTPSPLLTPLGRPRRNKKAKLDPDFVTGDEVDEMEDEAQEVLQDVKPVVDVDAGAEVEEGGNDRDGGPSGDGEGDNQSDGDRKPRIDEDDTDSIQAELDALGPKVVPPSGIRGREVIWEKDVQTIITTTAKGVYKLKQQYLNCLDRETRIVSEYSKYRYDYVLYSEQQVQQAAYDQHGGAEYFRSYIEKLHARRMKAAAKKGWTLNPLRMDDQPLAPVPYRRTLPGIRRHA